jgi:hypothetical protein
VQVKKGSTQDKKQDSVASGGARTKWIVIAEPDVSGRFWFDSGLGLARIPAAFFLSYSVIVNKS